MIEVIYDRDKQEKDESGQKEKNSFKMPKNIRQMGTPNPNKRIYIEDYVVTYLNYISRPGSTHARGAILLGTVQNTDNGMIIFISGAIDAQNIEFDLDENTFSREIWADIYKDVKDNFPELSVVGWFLSRMGFSTAINDKITKIHVDNFPGSDKTLYVYDSLDDDEAFYLFERGELRKQKGYYIYYARNEAMQNYIIKQKGDLEETQDNVVELRDSALIKNFREKNEKYKPAEKKSSMNFVYAAGSLVVVALLAIGISVVNNYDKMKNMEISINRLELASGENASETEDDLAEVAVLELATDDTSENPGGSLNEVVTETPSEDMSSDTEEPLQVSEEGSTEEIPAGNDPDNEDGENDVTTEEPGELTTEQSLPAMTDGNPTYYEVQPGDTLTSISMKNFDSIAYIDAIAEANHMSVDDKIYAGQKIIIPSIH